MTLLTDVQRAPSAEGTHEPEVISPERQKQIKKLLKQFPHLDYGTFVILTRLSQEELDEVFPSVDKAPEGYYDLKHPKELVMEGMEVINP